MTRTCPGSCSPFGTPVVCGCAFSAFASSHHHLDMNFCYIFLLLLVVLSAYSESPQYGKPPDPLDLTTVTVCPNSSSDPLGVLAPVLPQSEVFGSVQSQNMVLPQNEVYKYYLFSQNEMFGSVQSQNMVLPQNEVYKYYLLSQNEMFGSVQSQNMVLPQNEVFGSQNMILPQNKVYRTIVLPQSEVFESQNMTLLQNEVFEIVLPQGRIFRVVIVNWELSNKVKAVIDFVFNLGVESIKISTSTLKNGGEKLGGTIRILLESLQHVLKMYTWSMCENQASIQFKCKLIGLLLRRSLFRKHDFALLLHRVYHDYQNLHFWHLKFFSKSKNDSHTHIKEHTEKLTRYQFRAGGKVLLFSSDELLPYVSTDLHEQQYQFLHCITKKQKQSLLLHDGDVLCNVPLNILAPKLTLKTAKELANLHDMYMPSKILLKNAQILLEGHKCETCEDVLAIFRPFKVASNAECQQTWYQKNQEKCAESDKHRSSKFEYQESHKKSQKHYKSRKNVKFPPEPPSV